ncbi:hypothetical protein [Kitasatospora sp. NPDC004272]
MLSRRRGQHGGPFVVGAALVAVGAPPVGGLLAAASSALTRRS